SPSTAFWRPASASPRWTPPWPGDSARWWDSAARRSSRRRLPRPCASRSCWTRRCTRRPSSSSGSPMRAMLFERVGDPLRAVERDSPSPGPGELLIRVHACAVCRTDLHLLDGEVEIDEPPRILGHQIVGTVEAVGAPVEAPGAQVDAPGENASPAPAAIPGDRVGVPWLGWTDGTCAWCRSGRENLCPRARFTGRDIDGGYAEYTVADARFCFPIPHAYPDEQAAPLMCAGLIGYRALRLCGDARRTSARRRSPASSARCGPAPPRSARPTSWMRRSSSRRSARSSR